MLQFFGVIDVHHFAADPSIFQADHLRAKFDWNALGKMFTDPVGLLEARYGWGTADFAGQEFVTNLGAVLEVFGEPVRLRQLPRRVEEQLAGKPVPEADASPATQLIVSIDRSGDAQNGRDIGLSLYPLRASAAGATDAGVAIAPFVHGAAELSFPLAPAWRSSSIRRSRWIRASHLHSGPASLPHSKADCSVTTASSTASMAAHCCASS